MSIVKYFRATVFFISLFIFSASTALANVYPPKPAAHFYGDANGDTGITGADIVQHNNYILSKPYTYDTLQPNNSAQSWNTCDVDSNRGCTGADTVILNSYLLSKSVSILDDPWSVNNLNLPLTDNPAGTWIPFNIDLHSTHATLGLSGRPGVSVVVEIDPALSTGTGQFSGRECNPVAGTRDQVAAAGAQCALAVTQTNWPASAQTGPTESGTYGLQVMGDGVGDLKLKVYTVAIPGLDIPASSTRLTVSFISNNIALTCPSSVDEDATSSCTITASGPSLCTIGEATTCTGVTLTDCVQADLAAQGELSGPGSCIVEVTKGSASDSKIITIDEVNQPPNIDFASFPTLVGAYDTPENARGVYASGNYAYVADDYSGLHIVDIANPLAPVLTGTYNTPNYAMDVYMSGNYAYVADGVSGLQIIDISDPTAPTITGTYNTPGGANGIYVSGNFAYVADQYAGLQIIDISDPIAPTIAGTYTTPNPAYNVFMSGNYAYVADASSGLQIIDVTNPAGPTLIGTYNTPNYAHNVYVSGNYAYVADGYSGLQIIDTTNPAAPTLVGSYNTPSTALDVNVSGKYAYVADDESGLQIIRLFPQTVPATEYILFNYSPQVADPDMPQQTLTCSTNPSDTCGGNIDDCAYSFTPKGNQGGTSCIMGIRVTDNGIPAMYADLDNVTVSILDNNYAPTVSVNCPVSVDRNVETSCSLSASDADVPAQSLTCVIYHSSCVGLTISGCETVTVPPQGESAPLSCAVGVHVQDNNTPIGTGFGSDMIYITGINHPPSFITSPTLVGAYDTPDMAKSVYVSGNYAYVADRSSLQIIDVTNPGAPFPAGTYNTPGYASGVYVSGNYAYVTDGSSLQIIDVTNPGAPFPVGTYNTPGYARDVYVSENYAYVSSYGSGLQIIDVTNPAAPYLVGIYNTPDFNPYGAYINGNYAYVAAGNLQIIDVTDPGAPLLAGTYNTPGYAYSVYVSGNYAYVADESSLQIIDVTDPGAPLLAGTYNTPDRANSVYVSGNYAYVVDYYSGLQIIDITNPAAPTLIEIYDTEGYAMDVYVIGGYAYVADSTSGLQIIGWDPPAITAENSVLMTYKAEVTDPDYPAQTLTCSINPNDTCGGSPVDCVYSLTPSAGQVGTSCIMGLRVTDDGVPPMHADMDVTVSILDHNYIPMVSVNCPDSVDKDVETSCSLLASDADVPSQSLTCSIDPSSTCAGLTINGCATVTVPAQGDGAPVDCVVAVMVEDNYTPIGTDSDSDMIYITGNNHPPSFITSPTLLGAYDTPDIARNVYVSGNYAYVADYTSGLQIIDITNPAVPTIAGAYDTLFFAECVYVSGNYAYVVDGVFGLQIIDITNPAAPILAGDYGILPYSNGVYVSGNYAYVASDGWGLHIIDITNPAAPTLASSSMQSIPRGVYVSGNYAYVVMYHVGPTNFALFQIIDISNPTSPTLEGTYETPGDVRGLYVSGNYAYVADGSSLQIIDVTNPVAPTLAGYYVTPGYASGVYVSGNYAYVADYGSGIQIIDVSNPAAPTFAGTYDTTDIAWGIYVNGDYAYVADGNSGLQILRWYPPVITAENSVLMTYNATVSDPDYIPQNLTCSINPNDTCGGSLVDCDYSFTPGAGQIGTSCIMGLRVTDDGIPPMYGDLDITVDIY